MTVSTGQAAALMLLVAVSCCFGPGTAGMRSLRAVMSPNVQNSASSLTGLLTTYAELSMLENGKFKATMRYRLATDDGRMLGLDLRGVPGLGVGSAAATDCKDFVVTSSSNSSHGNTTFRGTSCASSVNGTLRSLLRRQGGVRVGVHQQLAAPTAGPVPFSGTPANTTLRVTSLNLLAQPQPNRRQLSQVTGSISLLIALVTACGQNPAVSVSDLTSRVLPLYNRWFKAASYGRASLDSRSTVMAVDIPCNVATSCKGAEDNIASLVKQKASSFGRFTNFIVLMPLAWESTCKPSYGGLGVVPGDTAWVRSAAYGLNYPSVGLHEMMHNFNLAHSNGANNEEYADESCVLSGYYPPGGRVQYPNGPHQWQLGWSGLVADLDMGSMASGSSRTYRLAPTTSSTASNLLRVRQQGTNYYVSYRVATELDSLPPAFDRKLIIQRLVGDQNNAAPTNFVASLGGGQTVTIDGFTIALGSSDGSGASVTVTRRNGGSGCPSVQGYTLSANADHPGDDITCLSGTDTQSAAAKCSADSNCKGFNVDSNVNHACMKTATNTFASSGVCFYTKSSQDLCPPISGYTAHRNVDHFGDDLICVGGVDVYSMAARCDADRYCWAFNLYNRDQGCTKNSAGLTITSNNPNVICYYIYNGDKK